MPTVRETVIAGAKLVVVKVGTNVLTDSSGNLNQQRIESLTTQVQQIRSVGREVVLVSSGAIGAGVGKLRLGKRPTDLAHLQACAAVGQSSLMQLYQESLTKFGVHAAQILLTAGDFDTRARYLNMRNTIRTLFEYGCLPIINENDTVSVAEIKFGDNDQLAAMVANLLQAPLLILLTNVDGLYTADPSQDPTARRLDVVTSIDDSVAAFAGITKSVLGTGGMKSKLRAARIATVAGTGVIMANGASDRILDRIFAAESVGTLFLPHGEAVPAWKRWLGYTAQPRGMLTIDVGAANALQKLGKSLLAVGVLEVQGEFGKGDVVSIVSLEKTEIARGLINYSAHDARRIQGRSTERILQEFKELAYAELIHRDNLVLVEPTHS